MTIFGWDASHFDEGRGPRDLAAAKAAGISFLTHKATEGTSFVDAQFRAMMVRAHAAKIGLVGAYHVLHTGSVNSQVSHFLAQLNTAAPWWDEGPFLVQLDVEHWPGDSPSPTTVKQWCDRFMTVTGGTHVPVVYASRGQYGNTLAGMRYPLWNAAYPSGTVRPFKSAYSAVSGDSGAGWVTYSGQMPAIWQYTSSATIGSQTQCDANAYRGTLAQLAALVHPATTPTPTPEDDMALKDEPVPGTDSARTALNVITDLENLRNWLVSPVGKATIGVPIAGSPLDLLTKSLTDPAPAVVLSDEQVAQIVAGVLADLGPALATHLSVSPDVKWSDGKPPA